MKEIKNKLRNITVRIKGGKSLKSWMEERIPILQTRLMIPCRSSQTAPLNGSIFDSSFL